MSKDPLSLAPSPAALPVPVRGATVRRVITVILDGLRPDALDYFGMTQLQHLAGQGAFTAAATTVSPSVTAAAMTSLFTGVVPEQHGVTSDRFHIPRPRVRLDPVTAVLDRAGLPVATFVRKLPLLFRPLGRACATHLRVRSPMFEGSDAWSILAAARETLSTQQSGLIFLHWPDADNAGHDHGWMSAAYGRACRVLDSALGALVRETGVLGDPHTLLIALADHGGGGFEYRDHDGDHPDNLTIPVLMAGGSVRRRGFAGAVSILDIAPTIASALGVASSPIWQGRAHDVTSGEVEHAA
ncbi:MAG TPA: alkaline phosphatase family protein [Gemmatimonadaceae bacterium]|nr:alkaline phosphatase family protein [Gemmatimonadaceae bacterium]